MEDMTESAPALDFKDGDVTVVLSPLHTLRLHSHVLKINSELFEELLKDEAAANLSNRAKNEGKTRFRIELAHPPAYNETSGTLTGSGEFVAMQLDTTGKPVATDPPQARAPPLYEGARVPNPVFEHYQAILATFYGKPFKVNMTSLAALLPDAYNIIVLIEYLRVKQNILQPIELGFIDHGQTLYRSIAKQSLQWLDLACRMRSVFIFKEASIHIIGQWNSLDSATKDTIDPTVRKMYQHKYDKLLAFKRSIEIKLSNLRVKIISKDNAQDPNTRKHSHKVIAWMGQECFKTWYCRRLAEPEGASAPDGGYSLYKKLAAGGNAYINERYQEDYVFLTSKGRTVLLDYLDEIKDEVKRLVQGLMINTLQLDTAAHPVPYLTCVTVKAQHCPWI